MNPMILLSYRRCRQESLATMETLPVLVESGADRRQGDEYKLEAGDVEAYKRDGYIRLPGLLSEEEVASIEKEFDKLAAGEVVPIPGKVSRPSNWRMGYA